MIVRCAWCVMCAVCMAAPHVAAQSGLTVWWGMRGYHGGPFEPIEHEFNFKPAGVRELSASYGIASFGRLGIALAGQYLDGGLGAIGAESEAVARGAIEGYSFRAALKYRLTTYGDGNALTAVLEPGIESIAVGTSPSETRAVAAVGLEFTAKASRRLGVLVGLHAAASSKSFFLDEFLPDGFENRNAPWTSLRVGVQVR